MLVIINLEDDQIVHRLGQLANSYSVIPVEQKKKCRWMRLIGIIFTYAYATNCSSHLLFSCHTHPDFLTPWQYMQRWGFLLREVINHLKDTKLISGRTRIPTQAVCHQSPHLTTEFNTSYDCVKSSHIHKVCLEFYGKSNSYGLWSTPVPPITCFGHITLSWWVLSSLTVIMCGHCEV